MKKYAKHFKIPSLLPMTGEVMDSRGEHTTAIFLSQPSLCSSLYPESSSAHLHQEANLSDADKASQNAENNCRGVSSPK